MKRTAWRAAVYGVLFCFLCGAAAAGEVGYVNVAKVMAETTAGKAATAEFKALKAKRQAVLDAKAKAVAAAKTPAMIDDLTVDYQRAQEDVRRELHDQDVRLMRDVATKMDEVVARIAKAKKLKMVFKEPRVLGWMDPAADITANVIKEMNKMK